MNLQAITAPFIGVVNPHTPCILRRSTGYITEADGKRVPSYADFPNLSCQVQPISTGDLRKLDALNIQGINNAIYLSGNFDGIDRTAQKGGDMVIQDDGTIWLVQAVLEDWKDWTKLAVVKQNGS